ncbi:MAG: hypothetical protein ACK4WH_14305 [Phycisphaerales bacterium]
MKVSSLWRARWNIARLAAASFVLWALLSGSAARLARLQLDALPDTDLLAEARALRSAGHFAEALAVCDAGLAEPPSPEAAAAMAREREEIAAEQRSLARRLKDLARGALTGGASTSDPDAPDPSLELLIGAVATDLFVIGDVRDLILQGLRLARGEKSDPVIIALSGVGLATTVAPAVDWAPALLKAARRAGAMSDGLAGFIRSAAAQGRTRDIVRLADDAAEIARHASPAGAIRIIRHADTADDAAKLARFLSGHGARGAYALKSTGAAGVDAVRAADSLRAAGKAADAAALERTLVKVGAKGRAGERFLRAGGARALMKPHPLVGLAKAVWKGNAEALVRRAVEAFDPAFAWALPACAAWVFVELALLLRRFLGRRMLEPRSPLQGFESGHVTIA